MNEVKINIDYLNEYLERKKMSNRQFADLIGVHESTISRILRGQKGVGSKFIFGIIQHLNDIDLKELLVVDSKNTDRQKKARVH